MTPPRANDSQLAPGQKLTEHWEIEFEGKESRSKPYRWVTCRLKHWYNGTYYGGSGGDGETVDEARLAMVLGTARAICDDGSAFQHDADEIFKGEMLRWFAGKLKELDDEFELESETWTRKQRRKHHRRVKYLLRLCAEWQEDYDYWPEENDAPASETAREEDGRTARRAILRAAHRVTAAVEALGAGSGKD